MIGRETGEWPIGIEEARQLREEVEEERVDRVENVNARYSEIYMFDDDPWRMPRQAASTDDQAREGYGRARRPVNMTRGGRRT